MYIFIQDFTLYMTKGCKFVMLVLVNRLALIDTL